MRVLHGVITQLSGLVPNAVLHVVLAAGFAFYWRSAGSPVRMPR